MAHHQVAVDEHRLPPRGARPADEVARAVEDMGSRQVGGDRVERQVHLPGVEEPQPEEVADVVRAHLVRAVGVDRQPLREVPLDGVRRLLAEGLRQPADRRHPAVDPIPRVAGRRQAATVDVEQSERGRRGVTVEGVAEEPPIGHRERRVELGRQERVALQRGGRRGRGLLGVETADLRKQPRRLRDPDPEQVEEGTAGLQAGDRLLGLREVVGIEAAEQPAVDQDEAGEILVARARR